MGMSPEKKSQEIDAMKSRFEESEVIVVTHYSGLTVSEISDLRSQLRAEGASFKVTKNTLAKLALKGTQFEHLEEFFSGPTGVATSSDPVAAAKVAHKFAKDNEKLIILGGAMGAMKLDKEGVEALAKLPSLDELRSKLVGLLQAPASKMVGVTQAPAQQMVGVTKAYGATGA